MHMSCIETIHHCQQDCQKNINCTITMADKKTFESNDKVRILKFKIRNSNSIGVSFFFIHDNPRFVHSGFQFYLPVYANHLKTTHITRIRRQSNIPVHVPCNPELTMQKANFTEPHALL